MSDRYTGVPHQCTRCNSNIRVGVVDGNDFGAFCDCTLKSGQPMHHMNGYPWPTRWVKGDE